MSEGDGVYFDGKFRLNVFFFLRHIFPPVNPENLNPFRFLFLMS